MSYIRVKDSNFLNKSGELKFIDGEFLFTKTAISSKGDVLPVTAIKSLNRLRVKKISGTNTNIFMNNFLRGTYFATFMEIFGFANTLKKVNRRIHVHFKDGKYIYGMTDLETFFDVQNTWLDSKPDNEAS